MLIKSSLGSVTAATIYALGYDAKISESSTRVFDDSKHCASSALSSRFVIQASLISVFEALVRVSSFTPLVMGCDALQA